MRKLVGLLALVGLLFAGTSLAQSTLEEVQSRGTLVCGVNNVLPGFGSVNPEGRYEGFDVDYCRAIAAAVLGDAEAVEFRALTAQERFTALQTGEVDVLIRNTTWTSSRDTDVGLNFAPTTFYDGQGFMTRRNSGINTLADMEGRRICVQTGTTTELNLADVLGALDISFTPVTFETSDQLAAAYDEGACDAWTTDRSGLVSTLQSLQDPSAHTILDVTISKEPLGPSVRHGDDQWFDIVKWVVFATFTAEEYGVTSENVAQVASQTENPELRRLFGLEGDTITAFGLAPDAMLQVIQQVGNYAEIYNRNLGPDTPFDLPRGLNQQYTDGGLLYAPPFR